jgi:hypothetical protein
MRRCGYSALRIRGRPNQAWWSETTDFCYVRNVDFWESPEGDCKFAWVVERDGDGADVQGRLSDADLRVI